MQKLNLNLENDFSYHSFIFQHPAQFTTTPTIPAINPFSSRQPFVTSLIHALPPPHLFNHPLNPYQCSLPLSQLSTCLYSYSYSSHQKSFLLLQPLSQFKLWQRPSEWESIVRNDTVIRNKNMDKRNKSTHDYWSPIAQVFEDACYKNIKPITPTSPISSTFCHYFVPY